MGTNSSRLSTLSERKANTPKKKTNSFRRVEREYSQTSCWLNSEATPISKHAAAFEASKAPTRSFSAWNIYIRELFCFHIKRRIRKVSETVVKQKKRINLN